jgi:hypothetical protein
MKLDGLDEDATYLLEDLERGIIYAFGIDLI